MVGHIFVCYPPSISIFLFTFFNVFWIGHILTGGSRSFDQSVKAGNLSTTLLIVGFHIIEGIISKLDNEQEKKNHNLTDPKSWFYTCHTYNLSILRKSVTWVTCVLLRWGECQILSLPWTNNQLNMPPWSACEGRER